MLNSKSKAESHSRRAQGREDHPTTHQQCLDEWQTKHLEREHVHNIYRAYAKLASKDEPFIKTSALWRASGRPAQKSFMRWLQLAAKHNHVELSGHDTQVRVLKVPALFQDAESSSPDQVHHMPLESTQAHRPDWGQRERVMLDAICAELATKVRRDITPKALRKRLGDEQCWSRDIFWQTLARLCKRDLTHKSGHGKVSRISLVTPSAQRQPHAAALVLPRTRPPALGAERIPRSKPRQQSAQCAHNHVAAQPVSARSHGDDETTSTSTDQTLKAKHPKTHQALSAGQQSDESSVREIRSKRNSHISVEFLVHQNPQGKAEEGRVVSSARILECYEALKDVQGQSVVIADLWRRVGQPTRQSFVDWITAEVKAGRAKLGGRGARVLLGTGSNAVFRYREECWGLIRFASTQATSSSTTAQPCPKSSPSPAS